MQPRQSGRPKDLKKRQAILQTAKDLFLELGYDGSSMDMIAQQAGVSKLTVYNHFKDKAQLFGAAIEMVCEQRLPKQYYHLEPKSDIQDVLQLLGEAFLAMVYSEEAVKLTHLMSSMVPINLELVHLFYNAGPERTRHNLYELFDKIKALDLLNITTSKAAADLFISLLTDCEYDRVIWKLSPAPDALQIKQIVAEKLVLFFKLYPKKHP